MAKGSGRGKGQPSRPQRRADAISAASDIVMAMGSAEHKAHTLVETPSEFAPAGDNPYRVTTVAPPVDAPRVKMARGLGRRPLI